MLETPGSKGQAAQEGVGSFPGPSLRNRLLSGGAWAFGGRVVTALTGLAINALLARLLSPPDLGIYFLAFSVVSLGATIGSLGLNQAVVRLVAANVGLRKLGRARQTIAIIYRLGVLGAVGAGITYVLFSDTLGNDLFHAPSLVAVTGLAAGWIVVVTLQGLLAETFRGFHDIRLATAFGGLVTGVILAISLTLLWLVREHSTLKTVILLAASSGFISALLASWVLQRRVMSLPKYYSAENSIKIREVLQVSWPLLVTSLAFFALTQADIWILGIYRSQEEVAIYGVAVRLVTLVAMPLLIVNAVLPPLIAEMYFQGRKRELEYALRSTAALAGVPAFLVLTTFTFFGGPILGLVFGGYYREGAMVLAVLSIGQLVNVWSGSCGLLLNLTGYQRPAMIITVVSTLVSVTVSLVIIGRLGMEGVALSFALGSVLQNVATVIYARKVVGVKPYIGSFLR